MKTKKHSFKVRWRLFRIWQHLGVIPWNKPRKAKGRHGSGDFYRGAFDGIPFLNEDAKRTFSHLLLRPGYMIRDYIHGQHERYLAPLTALIVFYAFFALLSAILQPVQKRSELPQLLGETSDVVLEYGADTDTLSTKTVANVAKIVQQGYMYLHLDQYPEIVDTQHETAIAALENTLRNQGIPLFLSEFFFLWLAMMLSLRRFKLGSSACAAGAAYVLCQFSFFMLFALLLTWGGKTSISVLLMLALLVIDYRQWLGLPWKKSFWKAVHTGVDYGLLYALMILLVSGVVLVVALLR